MEDIVQAISTIGFPIVAFLLVFLKLDKTLILLKEEVNKMTLNIQILLEQKNDLRLIFIQ